MAERTSFSNISREIRLMFKTIHPELESAMLHTYNPEKGGHFLICHNGKYELYKYNNGLSKIKDADSMQEILQFFDKV
jgi:hypothetical protein